MVSRYGQRTHGNLYSTCVKLLQMSASGAKEAGVEFTNGKWPGLRVGRNDRSDA